MKKLLTACCLALSLFLIGSGSALAATYVYSLDVDIPVPDTAMIGLVEFDVFGGVNGDNWLMTIGDAIPLDGVNWIDGYADTLTVVYDDYDWAAPVYAPMMSGNVLTISSDVVLTFSAATFYTYEGLIADFQYFVTDGFVEQSPVPIPGGIVLLGSGLIGLFGLARRKE